MNALDMDQARGRGAAAWHLASLASFERCTCGCGSVGELPGLLYGFSKAFRGLDLIDYLAHLKILIHWF